MAVRRAKAVWHGNLAQGKGRMSLGSGAFEGAYSFSSRFEEGKGTNPEELLGAAHAGCFSMAFAHGLAQAGYKPAEVKTEAEVRLEKVGTGFKITTITLRTEARVPGISGADFQRQAEDAKKNCPVSQAVTGVDVRLEAKLVD